MALAASYVTFQDAHLELRGNVQKTYPIQLPLGTRPAAIHRAFSHLCSTPRTRTN
jgi:hypothetical protein